MVTTVSQNTFQPPCGPDSSERPAKRTKVEQILDQALEAIEQNHATFLSKLHGMKAKVSADRTFSRWNLLPLDLHTKIASFLPLDALLQLPPINRFTAVQVHLHSMIANALISRHSPMYPMSSGLFYVCLRFGDSRALMKIQHLSVSGHYISNTPSFNRKTSDVDVRVIAEHCPRLTHLTLSNCTEITDAGIKTLATRCPTLRYLDLMGCHKVTDEGIIAITSSCPNLKHLCLCCKITDKGAQAIASHCQNLQILHFSGCSSITDTGVIAVASSCHQLTQLFLFTCKRITDESVTTITSHLPHIIALSLTDCDITNKSLLTIASSYPNLIHLDLANCSKITGVGTKEIAARCQHLRYLDLSNCDITDRDIWDLVFSCRDLRHLNLTGCTKITDTGVKAIARHCPHLEKLGLYFCNNITDASVKAIASGCPSLEYLNLRSCDKITGESLSLTLLSRFQKLTYLNITDCKVTKEVVARLRSITKVVD